MKSEKSKDMIRKKKKIIILLCLFTILAMVAIGVGIGSLLYHFVQGSNETQNGNVNTLLGEETNSKEENVLKVTLEENNQEAQNEQNNQSLEENNVVSKPKEVNAPYYIKINNQANVVTIYKKDNKGKYTVPVKAMVCSIGTATPASGVYAISDKYTWRLLEGDVYGQYACRITGSILFHSVPYTQKDKSTLEWWEYDKLGTKASLGCIRLTVQDAKWIYQNCIPGTKVEFYSSSTSGPLGKPTAKKITGDTGVRNWDPTDPDPANPWKNYQANQNQKPAENQNQSNNTNTTTNSVINNTVTNQNGNDHMTNQTGNQTTDTQNTVGKDNEVVTSKPTTVTSKTVSEIE